MTSWFPHQAVRWVRKDISTEDSMLSVRGVTPGYAPLWFPNREEAYAAWGMARKGLYSNAMLQNPFEGSQKTPAESRPLEPFWRKERQQSYSRQRWEMPPPFGFTAGQAPSLQGQKPDTNPDIKTVRQAPATPLAFPANKGHGTVLSPELEHFSPFSFLC